MHYDPCPSGGANIVSGWTARCSHFLTIVIRAERLSACLRHPLPVWVYPYLRKKCCDRILLNAREKTILERDFPGIQIVGSMPLAFCPISDREIERSVQKINESQASIIFVSLGCRNQTFWMSQQQSAVQGVMIGLGSISPQYVGLGNKSLNSIVSFKSRQIIDH
jgi:hypothetical protein